MMEYHAANRAILPHDIVVFREPTLADMLADPIVQTVMQADGVDAADLCALVEQVRRERG